MKLLFGTLLTACLGAGVALANPSAGTDDPVADLAALKAQVAALTQQVAALKKGAYHPELGEQMLTLQIRHARLWFAGDAQNWMLAAFQLNELKEELGAVVEQNGEHATFQPDRLADVLPAIMDPAIKALRDAIDKHSKTEFASAYDRLSASCNACHNAAGFSLNVIQRPKTMLLDNMRYAPPAPEKAPAK